MVKEQIITAVSDEVGCSRMGARRVIDSFLSNIMQNIADGKNVQLSGFGAFEPKHRAARTGRNPHTGDAVPIPARVIPYFKPGKTFMEMASRELNGGK